MSVPKLILIILLFTTPIFANASNMKSSDQPIAVVSSQPLATQVGYQILREGGNAIDAAVAVGYALAVTHSCCGNLGGGGFMIIHLANGTNVALNFREKAPLNISQKLFFTGGKLDEQKARRGYLAVGVPGTVMGLNIALRKYGTLPLTKVLQPAINLAENGFILSQTDANYFLQENKNFSEQPNVAAIFLKQGQSYQAGEKFFQPQLAKTLKLIAEHGSKAFYRGTIADEIVAASEKNGGVLSKADFANYNVQWSSPINCSYHGYQIISAPPPSAGGLTLCEMLQILKAYPLYPNSIISTHFIIEAMRYAYYDRNHYLGDPDFVNNPVNWLLSPQHIAKIHQQISFLGAGQLDLPQKKLFESPQTTQYGVIDRFGNAVSVTYTLNSYFGAKVIAGNTGFFLNDEMDDFTLVPYAVNVFKLKQGAQNLVQPGKRPLSSMAPTIIMKKGHLFLVIGAAGGSTIPTQILLVILNIIDFKVNSSLAISLPRYHMQWSPNVVYYEPFAFTTIDKILLQMMGYQLELGSPFGTSYWGITNAIFCSANKCIGIVDPRLNRYSVRF